MTRMRSLLLVVVTAILVLGVSAAAAQACTKTWNGGAGEWANENAWSPKGVPGNEDSVCITAPGTYSVVLPPAGGTAKSLTVGGPSGVQTVDVPGTSWIYGGETQHVTALSVGSASFASNTRLILEATEAGARSGTEPKGAGAFLVGGSVEEFGQIETGSSDPEWDTRIKLAALDIKPGGSLLDASGVLRFQQEGEGGAPWSATNEGTVTLDTGATVTMAPSFAGIARFTNDGSVANAGSITATATTWAQAGGSVTGNPVVLHAGSTLADSAGSGQFLLNYGTVTLTGTVPAGQTVKDVGSPFSYGGETYYETSLSLGGKQLVNNGTLELEAPGSGETGGSVNLESGSITNGGSIDASASPSRRVQILANITNQAAGQVEIESGLFDVNTVATTNEGLLTLAPGAIYRVEENGSLSNSGTISPEIASATSYGLLQLNSPCCSGPGRFVAGGILKPVVESGFLPAKREEFPLFQFGGQFSGTFAKTADGFSADYSHEESGYVGAVYHLPAPPEFGRCVKVAKGAGEFKTGACDSTQAGGSYEWVAGTEAANDRFTASGGAVSLESVGKAKIRCTGVSGSGEYSGTREFGDTVLRLTGCEGLGHKCTSASAQEGELVTTPLEGELGWEEQATHKVALDLFPVSGSGPLLAFTCGSEAVSVSGSVLANIKADAAPSLTSAITYKASKGKQKPEGFEGSSTDVLLGTFGAGTPEQSGLKLKLTLTSEEKLEVNATT